MSNTAQVAENSPPSSPKCCPARQKQGYICPKSRYKYSQPPQSTDATRENLPLSYPRVRCVALSAASFTPSPQEVATCL
jgi:hypothetical protein